MYTYTHYGSPIQNKQCKNKTMKFVKQFTETDTA